MAKLSSTHIYGDLSVDSAITENGQLLSSKYAAASHGTHLTLGTGSGNAFRGDYGNTAYNHSKAAHAPSNAQKNSDITKAEIEAKLTGAITTHTHAYAASSHTHNYAGSGSAGGAANSANILNINNTETKNSGRLQYFQKSNDSTIMPDTGWWSLIRTQHNGYDNGYWQEMAYAFASDTIKFRRNVNGTKSAWKTVAWTDSNITGSSGSCTGNAATATQFSANKSVALTGDVTGSASSKAGWSVATTLANSGVTAGSYGPSANASPAHGKTFSVPYITVDAKGRVTAASTKTITLPSDNNTDTKVTYTLGTTTKYYMGGPTATATGTGGITFDTGIYATTTAGQLSVGSLQTRGDITTSGNGSHAIGSTANRFSGIYGANIYSYDKNAKQYASLRLQTEGTADTQGVGRLTAGNNTKAGTAGNAKGQILLYGTNTGYTTITPGYNDTSNITLTLPSAGGTLARTSDNITGSSASCTGNAATATKLKTARSINGTNFDGTGNITTANWGTARKINQISVNGSADVKLPLDHYNCSVGDNNTKLYHHILSTGKVTGSWEDKSILIVIDGHYNGSGFGIARAVLRTNDAANGATASGEIKWLVRSGFSENQLCYNIRNTAKDTYMDVFYKSGGTYASATWYILSEGGRGSHGSQWTKNNTNASGTNAYTEADMKALRSYTATLQSAADHGAVSSAKTVSACTGNAATATKLKTARTISLGGLLSGSASFDGSGNVSISASIAKPPNSGDWFSGGITTVGTNGVMEIGKYLDFHDSDTTKNDYSTRIQTGGDKGNTITLPTGTGTLALTGHSHSSYLKTSGGTLTGPITVSGESIFHNGKYSDPWNGTGCCIKGTGNIGCTGGLRANGGVATCAQPCGTATSDGATYVAVLRYGSSRGICDVGTNNIPGRLYVRSGQGSTGSGVSLECAVTNGKNYLQYLAPESGDIALTKHLSDRTKKDNIVYVGSKDSEFTNKDFYDFIRDDLGLATYNYNKEYKTTDTHTKLNFIAQDILYDIEHDCINKVGNLIVQAEDAMEQQGSLRYDPEIYTSVIAGALKESINKIEELESEKAKMQAEIDELKADLTELKAIVKGLL